MASQKSNKYDDSRNNRTFAEFVKCWISSLYWELDSELMLFSIRIYSRLGECLYERSFTKGAEDVVESEGKHQVMFGLLFALKGFANQISPNLFVSR